MTQLNDMRKDLKKIRDVRKEMNRVINNQCKPEIIVGREGVRRFQEEEDGRVPPHLE